MPVRPAVVADVPAIAAVQVASWEGVYRGLMPDEVLEQVTVERRKRQWAHFFAEPPVGQILLVAEDGSGDVVGMASAGPSRDGALAAMVRGEVIAIYVDPDHWGLGYGRDLMERTLGELRRLGYRVAALWVLDSNERGRRFYERGGWLSDGSTKVDTSFGEPLSEVRYQIEL